MRPEGPTVEEITIGSAETPPTSVNLHAEDQLGLPPEPGVTSYSTGDFVYVHFQGTHSAGDFVAQIVQVPGIISQRYWCTVCKTTFVYPTKDDKSAIPLKEVTAKISVPRVDNLRWVYF